MEGLATLLLVECLRQFKSPLNVPALREASRWKHVCVMHAGVVAGYSEPMFCLLAVGLGGSAVAGDPVGIACML